MGDPKPLTFKPGERILHSEHGWGVVQSVDNGRLTVHFEGVSFDFGTYSTPSFHRIKSQLGVRSSYLYSAPMDIVISVEAVNRNRHVWSKKSDYPDWSKIAKIIRSDTDKHQSANDNLQSRHGSNDTSPNLVSVVRRNAMTEAEDMAAFIMRQSDREMEKMLKEVSQKFDPARALEDVDAYRESACAWLCRPGTAVKSTKSNLDHVLGDTIVCILTKTADPEELESCVKAFEEAVNVHLNSVFKDKMDEVESTWRKKAEKKDKEPSISPTSSRRRPAALVR